MEIAQAQKHSARLRAEADGQTKRLLEQRQTSLQKIEDEAKQLLDPIIAQQITLGSANDDLKRQQIELETTLSGLGAQISGSRTTITGLDQTIDGRRAQITDLEVARDSVSTQIEMLKAQITPLQEDLQAVRGEITDLTSIRDSLRREIDDFRTDYMVVKAEKERVVSVLDTKRKELELDIIDKQADFDAQREELARRQRAADDQDAVLRQRETKVNRDYERNRTNARLMNL